VASTSRCETSIEPLASSASPNFTTMVPPASSSVPLKSSVVAAAVPIRIA